MAVRALTSPTSAWSWVCLGLPVAWLGARLVVDGLLMPLLFGNGMMQTASFPSLAGEFFAWLDRLELLAAGLLLTASLLRNRLQLDPAILLATNLLLAIALLQTYWLTPSLSGLSFALQQAGEMPTAMPLQQGLLWALETTKLLLLALVSLQTSRRFHWLG